MASSTICFGVGTGQWVIGHGVVVEENGVPKLVVALSAVFTQVPTVDVLSFVAIHTFCGERFECFWGVFMATLTGHGLMTTLEGKRGLLGVIKNNLGPGVTFKVTLLTSLS